MSSCYSNRPDQDSKGVEPVPPQIQKICNVPPINKASLLKIKSKDSTQSQSLKLSNYTSRGKYMTIYEGQIADVKMGYATPNTAIITFGIVGYPKSIIFVLKNQVDPTEIQTISILQSPYTFQNLKPNSHYDITVTSNYSSKNTYTANFKNAVRTLNEGPPTELYISNITNHTAKVSFVVPIGFPDSVNITITNILDETDTHTYYKVTSPFAIQNLPINTTYDFKIQSVYSLTKNVYSIFVASAIHTLFEEFPYNIQFTNITNVSATIQYSYYGYPLYNIIKATNASDPTDTVVLNTLDTNVIIDLKSAITYNVTVTSVYSTGNKFPVETNNAFTILNEGPPQNIEILNVNGTNLLFSFSSAIGNVLEYHLVLQNLDYPEMADYTQTISVQNINNILITTLYPFSNYLLRLSSVYADNNQYTALQNFSTLAEGPISNFQVVSIQNQSITISFSDSPGDSLYYRIVATNINNPIETHTFISGANINTITGLVINNTYTFLVITNYRLTKSVYTYTYPNTVTTLNEGNPEIYSINRIHDTYAYANYNNEYGIVDSNTFNIKNMNTGDQYSILFPGDHSGDAELTGMQENTPYEISLYNTYSDGNQYNTVSPISIITRGRPTNITLNTLITDISVSILFTAPLATPTNYRLQYDGIHVDVSNNSITTVNNLSSYVINNLFPNTAYIIYFGAYYNDIDINYSALVDNFITKGPPMNIEYNSVYDNSATLLFDPPLLGTSNWLYTVYVYNVNEPTVPIVSIDNSNQLQYVISGLYKNSQYTVKLQSIFNDNILPIQTFTTYSNLITKSSPDNVISVASGLTNISATIQFTTLLVQPTYYILNYNYNNQDFNVTFTTSDITTVTNNSYYTFQNLNPSDTYLNIQLNAYYADIQQTYISNTIPFVINTKGPPINISVSNITNTTVDVSFTNPNYILPDAHIFRFQNNTTNNYVDISYNSSNYPLLGNEYSQNISNLLDNADYTLFVGSYYNSDNRKYFNSTGISFYTHGTPIIQGFTNVLNTSATVNIYPLLVPPTNYTINIKYTTVNGNQYDSDYVSDTGSYTITNLPDNLNIQVYVQSNYPESSYRSTTATVITRSYPVITNYTSTNTTAIIYFRAPSAVPTRYYYTINSGSKQLVTDTYTGVNGESYFNITAGLSQNNIYTVILYSYYADIDSYYTNTNGGIAVYTLGPPTDIYADPTLIFNTYATVSFTNSYNCSQYTIYANYTDAQNVTYTTPYYVKTTPFQELYSNSIVFKMTNLLENTLYNISVQSNYSNYNGMSTSSVQIKTLSKIAINSISTITDLSAVVFVTNPLQNPDNYYYVLNNNRYLLDPVNISNTEGTAGYTKLIIPNLIPNTAYTAFNISQYYAIGNITYVSNNINFNSKGLTGIRVMNTTDTTVTIQWNIPVETPANYYYSTDNVNYSLLDAISSTANNTLTATVRLLNPNTYFPYFKLATSYTDLNFYIYSNTIPFYSKMIPTITDIQISDVSLNLSFTNIITPDLSFCSYTIGIYQSTPVTTVFTPTIIGNNAYLSINGLVSNTFYSVFKINAIYKDQQIYSSINQPFNTMGYPSYISAILPPNNNNQAYLSFYAPLRPPDNYIVTNPNVSPSTFTIANTDSNLIFDNTTDTHKYLLENITRNKQDPNSAVWDTAFTGINISAQYTYLNKTISTLNQFNPINTFTAQSNILGVITDNSGQSIVSYDSGNIYYSYDFGNTWQTYTISVASGTTVQIQQVAMDTLRKYTIAMYQIIDGINITTQLLVNYVVHPTLVFNKAMYNIAVSEVDSNNTIRLFITSTDSLNVYASQVTTTTANIQYVDDGLTNYKYGCTYMFKLGEHTYWYGVEGNGIYTVSVSTSGYITTYNTFNQLDSQYLLCSSKQISEQFSELLIAYGDSYYKSLVNYQYSDAGTTLRTTYIPDSSLNWNSLSCDVNCQTIVATNTSVGVYLSNNGGNTWSIILPTIANIQNAFISGDGNTIYAHDNTRLYNYIIPQRKGGPTYLSINYETDQSANIYFYSPKYLPDLSYSYSLLNNSTTNTTTAIIPYNNNVILTNLTADTQYKLIVYSNYSTPLQSFPSDPLTVYTLGPPKNVSLYGNPSNTSFNIKFIAPNNTPDHYNVYINEMFSSTIYGIDLGNGYLYDTILNAPANAQFNMKLSSYYVNYSQEFFSNSISITTRGPPDSTKFVISNIYDTSATLQFEHSKNIASIDNYSIFLNNTSVMTTSQISDNILQNLTADTLYNLQVQINYTDPVESYKSESMFFITKSGPLNLTTTSMTDVSGILWFQLPKAVQSNSNIVSKYTLQINNEIIDVSAISVSTTQSKIILKDLSLNTQYLNTTLSVEYNDILQSYASSPITINTEGYPANVQSDFYKITDQSANIIFSPSYISPNNYKVILYDSTQTNLIYDVLKPDSPIILDTLTADTSYNFYIQAIYDNLISTDPSIYTFYTAGPPLNVVVQTNSIMDTSATVQWSSPNLLPVSYTILFKSAATNTVLKSYSLIDSMQTSYTMTDLPINTNGYVVIQSIYPNTTLSAISSSNFITKGPPQNAFFVVNSITDASAIIQYSPPANLTGFQSYRITVGSNTYSNITSPYKINSLMQNTSYAVTLQSIYTNLISSTSLNFITEGIPQNVEINDISDTSANLTFTLCPNTPDTYNLLLYNRISEVLVQTITNISASPTILNDLYPSYNYSASLQAVYSSTTSSSFIKKYNSSPVIFTTKGLNNNNIVFTNVKNNDITIAFPNPSIVPNTIVASIQNASDGTGKQTYNITPISGTNVTYTRDFPNLTPNTNYEINIRWGYTNAFLNSIVYKSTKTAPLSPYIDINTITDVSATLFVTVPLNPPPYYHVYLNTTYASNRILTISGELSNYVLPNLVADASYQIVVECSYNDVIYVSDTLLNITTRSPPLNKIYPPVEIMDYQTATLYYSSPINTTPDSISLYMDQLDKNYNVINSNLFVYTGLPNGDNLSQTFTPLITDTLYRIRQQTLYSNPTMTITKPIIFNSVGKPNLTLNIYYAVDSGEYYLNVQIAIRIKPNFFTITIIYPDGVTTDTYDTEGTATIFTIYNLTQLGEYQVYTTSYYTGNSPAISDTFTVNTNSAT